MERQERQVGRCGKAGRKKVGRLWRVRGRASAGCVGGSS